MNPIIRFVLQLKDEMSGGLQKAGTLITGFAKAAGAALVGLGAGLLLAVKESIAAEREIARLALAVKNAGGDFDALAPSIQDAIDKVQRLSVYSEGQLRNALTNLITITGDVSGSVKNLGLAADFAAFREISLHDASLAVAKAMAGNTKALNALGIEGKTADVALANLQATVGGFAEVEAQQLGGRLQQLKNAWADFLEAVGTALTDTDSMGDAVQTLTEKLRDLGDRVDENRDSISRFGELVGAAFDVVRAAVGSLWDDVANAWPTIKALTMDLFGSMAVAAGEFLEAGKDILRFIGIDLGEGVAEKLIATGERLQAGAAAIKADMAKEATETRDLLKSAWAKLVGDTEDSEGKRTKAVGAGKNARIKIVKEEGDDRTKAEKDLAKELERINEQIAIRTLQIEEGLTKAQAKEALRRRRMLGEQVEGQVTDLATGYAEIDRLNLIVAAGFTRDVVPAVKTTSQVIREFGVVEIPRAEDAIKRWIDSIADASVKSANLGADVRRAGGKVRETELDLGDAARAAIGFAQGLEGISDEAAAGLQNVVSFVEAAGKLGSDPSALVGVVGSLAGILGQIFGGNDAHKKIVEDNTRSIDELSRVNGELLRLNTPGREFAGIGSALGSVFGQLGDNVDLLRNAPGQGKLLQSMLLKALVPLGLGIGDLDDLAKDLGITIRGSGGGFTVSGLEALLNAIGQVQFSTFGDTFASQQDRIARGVSLGAIDKGDELAQLVGLLQSQGATGILGALSGLDLSTAEGSTEAVANLRQLFNNIDTLSAEEFGGLTGAEFLDTLQQVVDLLSDDVADLGGVLVGPRGSFDPFTDVPGLDLSFGEDLTEAAGQQITILESIDAKLGLVVDHTARTAALTAGGDGVATVSAQGLSERLYEDLYDARLARGVIDRG